MSVVVCSPRPLLKRWKDFLEKTDGKRCQLMSQRPWGSCSTPLGWSQPSGHCAKPTGNLPVIKQILVFQVTPQESQEGTVGQGSCLEVSFKHKSSIYRWVTFLLHPLMS